MNDEMMKEKIIKDILKQFDFKKVHNYMESVNWTWLDSGGDMTVPSIATLVLKAESYLNELVDRENTIACGSGGLMARKSIYKGKIISLKLEFILEDFIWEDLEDE